MNGKRPTSPFAFEVLGLSYSYPGAGQEALRNVSLAVAHGECVCMTGPSGCGKSTLLLALASLLKGGTVRGEWYIDDSLSGPPVGIVFQNAESQILTTTVADEVAFGPTNLNVRPDDVDRRVASALDAVGLTGFETRNVEGLSAGEKHRLALASVLSMEPALLFLDEPSAQLDGKGKRALRDILRKLKERSFTIVVADHDVWTYEGIADRFVFMDEGRIEGQGDMPREVESRRQPARRREGGVRPGAEKVASLENVRFSHQAGSTVIGGLSMRVFAGERIHIFGENGAGKSTLFRLMTGLLKPEHGTVDVLGIDRPSPEKLKGAVGLLLQNPVRQLFENTVGDEAAFALRRQKLPAAEVEARVADALAACDVTHLRDRSPLSLSYGEKHRVTLASLIALKPRVLLLDEPFSGLDFGFRERMLDTLRTYGERHGCTMVAATHDVLVDPGWADRCFILKNGKLVECDGS